MVGGVDGKWRYVYEALVHVSSLRLFLSNDSISPIVHCNGLKARLHFASRLNVSCEWITENGVSKGVAVPVPLCALDHFADIESFAREDHIEVKLRLLDVGESFFTLATDETSAAAVAALPSENTHIYCRKCDAALSIGEFSCVLPLPSVDWRDISEHWFGVCCCSSSIRTESVVARFEENIMPSKGKLLVGDTTCILHVDNISQDTFFNYSMQEESLENLPQNIPSVEDGNAFYDFLKGPVKLMSSGGQWVPFHCHNCSAMVGAMVKNSTGVVKNSVHLFKRHISTGSKEDFFREYTLESDLAKELLTQVEESSSYRCIIRGLKSNKPMLQMVIVNVNSWIYCGKIEEEEEEEEEEEAVVKGDFSNLKKLKPVVSIMYCDCHNKERVYEEEWRNADDIYMMEEEGALLRDHLISNQMYFPKSSGDMQSLAFLNRNK